LDPTGKQHSPSDAVAILDLCPLLTSYGSRSFSALGRRAPWEASGSQGAATGEEMRICSDLVLLSLYARRQENEQ
jgi:hypothetical protein